MSNQFDPLESVSFHARFLSYRIDFPLILNGDVEDIDLQITEFRILLPQPFSNVIRRRDTNDYIDMIIRIYRCLFYMCALVNEQIK